MLRNLVFKFLKARWGAILPEVFKAAAEGRFGPRLAAFYWRTAQYKTISGAVLMAVGAGLETVCASFPDMAWSCGASRYVYLVGGFLAVVGLADGGTRAPWPSKPDGSPSWQGDK